MKKTLKVKEWAYKYTSLEMHDAWRPNIPGFVHEETYVSARAVEFHGICTSGAGQLENGKTFHTSFGVTKRLWRVSRAGVHLNRYSFCTGKNDSE